MLNCLNEIWDSIVFSIKKHKVFFFVLLSCILITLIVSVITSISYFHYFTIQNLTDKLLVEYLNKKIGLISYFFKRLFQYIFLIALIYLFSCNKYTIFINVLLCCFITFNVVFNFIILISLFGLFGLIHGILVTLLCGTICLLVLIILTLLLYSFTLSCSNIGDYFTQFKNISKIILATLLVFSIITLFEILIIPFSTTTFIVVF